MRRFLAAALSVLLPATAHAQSSPGWPQGFVPPAYGTDASTGLPGWNVAFSGKADWKSCTVRPSRAYAGAMIGGSDLAVAGNVPNLQATQNAGFYLASYGMTQIAGLSASAIQANWTAQAPGILEVGTDPVNMPDIASTYAAQLVTGNTWTWGTTKGTTWPAVVSAAGWRPAIAMLNPFGMATTNSAGSDPYYAMNLAAMADVKAKAPSVQYVLSYLTPNGSTVSTANNNTAWTGTFWGESRALATAAGGLGLDTPANYFMHAREPAYRALVAQEIAWANANGLISVVLLSPYALGAAGTPQFTYDPTFMEAAQQEVAYLHSAGADPTFYVATNYSEGVTNEPGSDTGSETINALALWLARSAPTSPMPATVPSGFQTQANASCASALVNGRGSPHALASDIEGIGGLGLQSGASANITGGMVSGLSTLSLPAAGTLTLGSDGGAPFNFTTDGVGNLSILSTNGGIKGNLKLSANVQMLGSNALYFNFAGASPANLYADGAGNLTINPGTTAGALNVPGGSIVLGASNPLTISNNNGNSTISNPVSGGNINIANNLRITGAQAFYLNSNGAAPASLVSDGVGNLAVNTGVANGNLNLTGNAFVSGALSVAAQGTPASSTAACTKGTLSFDTGFLYYCTATNHWGRAALATTGW